MLLTRRTNVLFTEEDYLTLSSLAEQYNKTIGELVRRAVKKTYKITAQKMTANQEAFRLIAKATRGMNFTGLDYKALADYGRKY